MYNKTKARETVIQVEWSAKKKKYKSEHEHPRRPCSTYNKVTLKDKIKILVKEKKTSFVLCLFFFFCLDFSKHTGGDGHRVACNYDYYLARHKSEIIAKK